MKRWMRNILLAAAVAVCLSNSVLAYDQELDPETGEPIGSGNSSFYEMADGGQYIYDTNRYVYKTSSVEIGASIPNGAVVSYGETVSLWPSSTSNVLVYRDGDLTEISDLHNIRQSGSYVVNVAGNDSYGAYTFRFTILPELTCQITELSLPEGFLLDYVLLETVPQDLPYGDLYRFSADGTYEVRYSCAALNKSYVLRFTLDTTPPVLVLPGVTNGIASGAVTVTVPETGALIQINCDGDITTLQSGHQELRQPGRYQLKVYDQAGNVTQYDFTIQFYLDFSAGLAIALLAAALVAVAIYCHLVRKNARVG